MAIQHEILGDDMQALIIDLAPNQLVRAEPSTMMYKAAHIDVETSLDGGKNTGLMDGLMSGLKRVVTGESLFITTFKAQGAAGRVAFTPPYPGKIIHLDLKQTGPMLCQRDAFLCSEANIEINIAFTKRLGAGFFGGEGFILQKLAGDGEAFIHSGGLIVPMDLKAGEKLHVDTGCLVAFQESVDYDIQMVKGVKTMLFGGEGLFYASLTGPGRIYLQTLPFSRMADRIISASSMGTGTKEESKGVAGIGGDILGSLMSGN